jgi:hypothetical protein
MSDLLRLLNPIVSVRLVHLVRRLSLSKASAPSLVTLFVLHALFALLGSLFSVNVRLSRTLFASPAHRASTVRLTSHLLADLCPTRCARRAPNVVKAFLSPTAAVLSRIPIADDTHNATIPFNSSFVLLPCLQIASAHPSHPYLLVTMSPSPPP